MKRTLLVSLFSCIALLGCSDDDNSSALDALIDEDGQVGDNSPLNVELELELNDGYMRGYYVTGDDLHNTEFVLVTDALTWDGVAAFAIGNEQAEYSIVYSENSDNFSDIEYMWLQGDSNNEWCGDLGGDLAQTQTYISIENLGQVEQYTVVIEDLECLESVYDPDEQETVNVSVGFEAGEEFTTDDLDAFKAYLAVHSFDFSSLEPTQYTDRLSVLGVTEGHFSIPNVWNNYFQ